MCHADIVPRVNDNVM